MGEHLRTGERQRGRRLTPEARREQIVLCAVRLFGERPYAQVSQSEIAREAGVARGLLNHYFGDKRELYLEVVRRAVLMPTLEGPPPAVRGTLEERIERAVAWFLESVRPSAASYVTVLGSEGVAEDPEVSAILAQADDLAARWVLRLVEWDPDDDVARAVVRSYGGMAKATVREWARFGTLTRPQAHAVLAGVLSRLVTEALPALRQSVE